MTTRVKPIKAGGDSLNKLALGLHIDAGAASLSVGATSARPTGLTTDDIGHMHFDTTLGFPVFWTGSAWHNAAGSVA
jgi:hypothetical protein